MPTIKSLNKWANAHTYYPLDLLRISLGVFLFIKGINFISNSQILVDLIKPVQNLAGSMIIIHYVAPAHLIGGILIAFGLLTRWSVMAQLPLLFGAVLINFIGVMNTANLVIASIIFLICIFFLLYGSGKHSVDYYLKMEQ
ncbi:DoxX family membrane protein [Aquimarina sp. AD10]|uniref:DoxX family protein n=1 Tax=Aquimarina sp. AD10 TaxID=1714849 RepID=UPI000E4FAA2D|nr:DoxX family protein [Aquimarina sp. AD10]AXT61019.1 DoxX family membrane protein [Aquimarina sp. AD10]RKM96317.1 DoxX family membrane protein [Aquimarina sp. AD10]